MHNLLEVKQLGYSLRNHGAIFENIDFTIGQGEAVGLLGNSGCGKTTLAKCLMNLLPCHSGKISFDGREVATSSDMQIVFQDSISSLNPAWIVEYLLEEPLKLHQRHLTGSQRRKRVLELLDWVELEPAIRKRLPQELSGGQRQRVNIARALAVEPKLLILDEPVSQLDASVQNSILKLLIRLQEEHGYAYLFISHDVQVLKMVCHRILKMESPKGVTQLLYR